MGVSDGFFRFPEEDWFTKWYEDPSIEYEIPEEPVREWVARGARERGIASADVCRWFFALNYTGGDANGGKIYPLTRSRYRKLHEYWKRFYETYDIPFGDIPLVLSLDDVLFVNIELANIPMLAIYAKYMPALKTFTCQLLCMREEYYSELNKDDRKMVNRALQACGHEIVAFMMDYPIKGV